MIIDAHAHIYPDKIAESVVQKLSAPTGLTPSSNGTARGLLLNMQISGIDKSVILPVATNPLKVDHLNDFAFSFNGQNGLYSMGAMHPDCTYYREELARIAANGIKAVKIHPVYQGVDFDDIRYLRIFERASELGLFIITHAGYDIGFPNIEHALYEKIENAIKAVGNFKLVLAHMGNWENWNNFEDFPIYDDLYIDTSFSLDKYIYRNDENRSEDIIKAYGKTGNFMKAEQFTRYLNKFGADHILFGSDSPWDDPAKPLNFIRNLPINEADKKLILGENAARIFKI